MSIFESKNSGQDAGRDRRTADQQVEPAGRLGQDHHSGRHCGSNESDPSHDLGQLSVDRQVIGEAGSRPDTLASPVERLESLLRAFQRNTPEVWSKAMPQLEPLPDEHYSRAVDGILKEVQDEGWHPGFRSVIANLAIPLEEFHNSRARLIGRQALKRLIAAYPSDRTAGHSSVIAHEKAAIREVFDLTPADERALGIELISWNFKRGKLVAAAAIASLLGIADQDLIKNPVARRVIPLTSRVSALLRTILPVRGGADRAAIGRGRLRFEAVLAGKDFQGPEHRLSYHKQHRSFSCGAASMRMVLESLYDRPISEKDALRLVGTTEEDGTPLRNFEKIEDEFPDLDAVVGEQGTPQELARLLRDGYLIVINYSPKGPHYAVLFGVGNEGIALYDPWLGPMTSMSLETLNSLWRGGYRETKVTEKGYAAFRRDSSR